jgi:hypothetical protein
MYDNILTTTFNYYLHQSRADAAEETVKALSEIMKEKDKEIETANVRRKRKKKKG